MKLMVLGIQQKQTYHALCILNLYEFGCQDILSYGLSTVRFTIFNAKFLDVSDSLLEFATNATFPGSGNHCHGYLWA